MREATAMLTETRVKKLTSESGVYSSAGGSICTPLSIKRIFFLDFRAKPHRCWIRGHFLFHL